MPLHEYLERKRRQNIKALNASGACHICGSSGRDARGFHHFLDDERDGGDESDGAGAAEESIGPGGGRSNDSAGSGGDGFHSNEESLVPRPNLAAMRTCACFGQSPSDPDYWPYSLRVCEKCIEDDAGVGRIRSCGICGTVACDEDCGAELLECTDRAEWNNAGCLECRGISDFSEIELFRRSAASSRGGNTDQRGGGGCQRAGPRIARICAKCLDTSTPWVKYDFVCRRFRCQTRLVPSDVAERKRFCTFGSSPLNLLPGDSLVAVVDFLTGSDLKQLFLTCSAMCTVAERVAKEKVTRVSDQYPTGPIVIAKRKDGFGQDKNWTHFEGTNDFGLCAPDDEKAWVGVYHYLEKITKEMFYFGFQAEGPDADVDAAERFIDQRGRNNSDRFTFGQTFSKLGHLLVPCQDTAGISVRGSCVLINAENASPVSLTVASSEVLTSGTRRLICRLFCPGSGGARGATAHRLGVIGLLRTDHESPLTSEAPANIWAHRADLAEGWAREEVVIGIEYDADARSLVVRSCPHTSRASRFASHRHTIAEGTGGGHLRVAVELSAKAVNVVGTLLTVREVDAEGWAAFVEHTSEGVSASAVAGGDAVGLEGLAAFGPVGAERAGDAPGPDAVDAFEAVRDANAFEAVRDAMGDARDADGMANVEWAVRRFEARNRRRERPAGGDNEGGFRGVRARALEEGRRAAARLMPARQEHEEGPVPAGVDARVAWGLPRDPRSRRVVRALRPSARAAAAEQEMLVDGEDAGRQALAEAGVDDDDLLVNVDEEVAAGEFIQQVETEQVWQPAEEPEPRGMLLARETNLESVMNPEGNAANNA